MIEIPFEPCLIKIRNNFLPSSDEMEFECDFHHSLRQSSIIIPPQSTSSIERFIEDAFDATFELLTPYWMRGPDPDQRPSGGHVFRGIATSKTIVRCRSDGDAVQFFRKQTDKMMHAMEAFHVEKSTYCVDVIAETAKRVYNCISCFPTDIEHIDGFAYINLQADWVE